MYIFVLKKKIIINSEIYLLDIGLIEEKTMYFENMKNMSNNLKNNLFNNE